MGNKQSSNTQQPSSSSSATSASSSSSTTAVPPHALPRRNNVATSTQSSAGGYHPTATSSASSYAEAAAHGNLRRINQSATPMQTVISQPPPQTQQLQQTQPQLPPPPTTAQRYTLVSRTQTQRPQVPGASHRHGSVNESAEANPYIMIMQLLQEALGNSSTTATNPNTRVIYRTGHPTSTTPLLLRPPQQQQQVPRNRAQFDPWMMLLENLVEEADMRHGGGASLQQLMQQMEPVNRGISQEQIEAESMKFTLKDVQKELPKDQMECPICLSEFSTGETLRRLPCLHVYHADCVDKWIQANATCPTCRIDLKELLRQQQEFGFVE